VQKKVKKSEKNLRISKKSSTFAPAFQKLGSLGFFGAPGNFNFWGEREHGENSYERRGCESY